MRNVLWFSIMPGLLAVSLASAEDTGYYRIPLDVIRPGLTAEWIRRGVFLGEYVRPVAQCSGAADGSVGAQLDAASSCVGQADVELRSRPPNPSRLNQVEAQPLHLTAAWTSGVTQSAGYDLDEFVKCSRNLLPSLRLRDSIKDPIERMQFERDQIQITRGTSESPNQAGIACGKFLGESKISVRSNRDEIKLITAVSACPAVTRDLLCNYLLWANPGSPSENRASRSQTWRALALHAVFNDQASACKWSGTKLSRVEVDYCNGKLP